MTSDIYDEVLQNCIEIRSLTVATDELESTQQTQVQLGAVMRQGDFIQIVRCCFLFLSSLDLVLRFCHYYLLFILYLLPPLLQSETNTWINNCVRKLARVRADVHARARPCK